MSRAAEFFNSIVKPTADEFLRDVRNIRRGCLAAIVLFHMADYWDIENNSNPTPRTLKTLHGDLIKNCPEFLFIRDVANASKHHRLTINPNPPRSLSSSEDITRTFGLFEAPFGMGAFNEAIEVIITLDDGTSRPFSPIVRTVLSMWESKLQ